MKKFEFGSLCSCGKVHKSSVDKVICERGAIEKLPALLAEYGILHPALIADRNTQAAAGERVCDVLSAAGIKYSEFIFPSNELEPDERAVGSAVMHLDKNADAVIAIGSGCINDISKIVSKTADLPYFIVATAPSMDGYASATSSMVMDGLKVSLPSKCPNVIIGDIDVLEKAPEKMLVSGLGDMLAKYVSIAEWRIAALLCGEYYCEYIAEYIRYALSSCTENIEGLLKREEKYVAAVFSGLIACGAAMEYAGLSRPASGVEHYISHIWDMRDVELGTPSDTHGIQCAIGTYMASKLYYELIKNAPDRTRAKKYVEKFDFSEWEKELSSFLGNSAVPMIEAEARDGKYDKAKHSLRLEKIISEWDTIVAIIREEIPDPEKILDILNRLGCPTSAEEIGISSDILPMTFKATKDIRDKYVLSRLAWDLGLLDELANNIK